MICNNKNLILLLAFILIGSLIGCGGSGPGGGTSEGAKAKITGTVAGTVVVAIDENGNEVDRQTAKGIPKTFTLTLPVGGNYRIYLLENEGTANERVFSLFQGTVNVFAISSATTVDLGFVDTSTGVAVPTNSPLDIPGVGSGGSNAALPPSIAGSGFTLGDLQGTWDFHDLISGDFPGLTAWEFATLTIDSGGILATTSITRSNGDSNPLPPLSFSISSSGVVTSSSTSLDIHGSMNSQKDRIVGVMANGGGSSILFVYSKRSATTFSTNDLEGTWNLHALVSGDSPQWTGWFNGQGDADAAGNLTFSSSQDSEGSTRHAPPGIVVPLAVDANGVVTETGNPSFHGTMNSAKDLIVATDTDPEGGFRLLVLQKVESTASFTPSDLTGSWKYVGLISGDSPAQTPGWYRGTFNFDGVGSLTSASAVTDSLGNSDFTPSGGTFNLSPSGILTLPSVPELKFHGTMNGGKNMIMAVATMAPGRDTDVKGFNLMILLK